MRRYSDMMITNQTLAKLLRKIAIDRNCCLGCGHERSCSVRGCSILKMAADRLEAGECGH